MVEEGHAVLTLACTQRASRAELTSDEGKQLRKMCYFAPIYQGYLHVNTLAIHSFLGYSL